MLCIRESGRDSLYCLEHLLDQSVDLVALLTASTTLVEVVQLLADHTTSGVGQLHGPQKVSDSLELRADSEDLVHDVLDALETLIAKTSLDDSVAANRNTLARHLHETSLVDQVLDGLKVGVAVSDEGLNKSEHVHGGSVDAHEHTVVDLAKSQKLKDLLHLGGNTNNTSDTDNEDQLLLRGNEYLSIGLGGSSVVNGSLLKLRRNKS